MPRRLMTTLVWLAFAAAIAAQAPATSEPIFEIRFPAADTFLTGPVVLRTVVDPPSAVTRVTFFVDAREVCVVVQPPFECDWDAGPDVVERQLRVVATLTSGKRLVRTVRTQGLGFAEKVDVDVVQVTVTVTDDRGEFVAGLPQSAFHVLEDGKPQTITYFASEDVPLELVVAVDISGSMTAAMPKLKESVKDFLGAVPAENQADAARVQRQRVRADAASPTDPPERGARRRSPGAVGRDRALRRHRPRHRHARPRSTGRKALVVFSDGEDQGSHVTLDEVERRLQASDVTLYMIGQGRGLTSGPPEEDDGAVDDADRRARLRHGQHQSICSGAFDDAPRRAVPPVLCSGIRRPTKSATTRGARSGCEVDGHKNVRARTGYRFSARP